MMEEDKSLSPSVDPTDTKEIPFSRTVKAGKRVYYIDVKKTRQGGYYLALTESKKITSGGEDNPQVTFEKHKLFLYPEDFDKVTSALQEAVAYMEERQGKAEPRVEMNNDIRIDLDF